MLQVTNLGSLGNGDDWVRSFTYTDVDSVTAGAAFSKTMSIGEPSYNRYIVLAVTAEDNTSMDVNQASATVNGVACAKLAGNQIEDGDAIAALLFITSAPISSDTTATVAVTVTGHSTMIVSTYSLVYADVQDDQTQTDTAQGQATTVNVSIRTALNKFLIAVSGSPDPTNTCTWGGNGINEAIDTNNGTTHRHSAAILYPTVSDNSYAVGATWNLTGPLALAAASFR
jgi:hypothetical protein